MKSKRSKESGERMMRGGVMESRRNKGEKSKRSGGRRGRKEGVLCIRPEERKKNYRKSNGRRKEKDECRIREGDNGREDEREMAQMNKVLLKLGERTKK